MATVATKDLFNSVRRNASVVEVTGSVVLATTQEFAVLAYSESEVLVGVVPEVALKPRSAVVV